MRGRGFPDGLARALDLLQMKEEAAGGVSCAGGDPAPCICLRYPCTDALPGKARRAQRASVRPRRSKQQGKPARAVGALQKIERGLQRSWDQMEATGDGIREGQRYMLGAAETRLLSRASDCRENEHLLNAPAFVLSAQEPSAHRYPQIQDARLAPRQKPGL